MKHSFYPTDELESKLRAEAHNTRRSIGKVVCDILELHYATIEKETVAEEVPVTIIAPVGLTDMLLANGLRYEDKRPKGGTVWVYDEPKIEKILVQVETRFKCKWIKVEGGSKATNGKPAWYVK